MKQMKEKHAITKLEYAIVSSKLWEHKNDNIVEKKKNTTW